MKDIIEALFYGRISPAEHSIINNSRYSKAINVVSEKEEQFLKSLVGYDKNLYNEYKLAQIESLSESALGDFKLGFMLGSRFMLSMMTKLDYDE